MCWLVARKWHCCTLRMAVALNEPHGVGLEGVTATGDFALLEAPLGQWSIGTVQDTLNVGMHEANLAGDCMDRISGLSHGLALFVHRLDTPIVI